MPPLEIRDRLMMTGDLMFFFFSHFLLWATEVLGDPHRPRRSSALRSEAAMFALRAFQQFRGLVRADSSAPLPGGWMRD